MDWLLLLIFAIIAYAGIALVIRAKNLFPDHTTFYGPILALRSRRVGFLDAAIPYSSILRVYGTVGAVIVIIVSVAMVVMLFFSLQFNLATQPSPTAINDPRNLFTIPGVNEFIPFTIPVWIALMVTLVVHEFGHGILARVENIRVKFIGVLFLVIPIGAFVEPDEEEFEKAPKVSKIRMLGAGITNNMVIGILCFLLFLALLGMAVPNDVPLIKTTYVGYPAAGAGIPPNSVITGIDGAAVTTRSEVSSILNRTQPGDTVTLELEKNGQRSVHTLTLVAWPESIGARPGGFMGVSYYDAGSIKNVFDSFANPVGLFLMLAVPIQVIIEPSTWGFFVILLNDTADTVAWTTPFPSFWPLVQILFWCAWFNIMVALCNALPMVPLDGGYILKEGTEKLLERSRFAHLSANIVTTVSFVILFVLALVFTLPHLLHM
jgi:membrane-associated protease RseP (regulator of RpoE activity)